MFIKNYGNLLIVDKVIVIIKMLTFLSDYSAEDFVP